MAGWFGPFESLVPINGHLHRTPIWNTRKENRNKPGLLLLALLVLGLLEHLLDDLLLLNQESSDNTVSHAVGASRAAICALHGLLGSGGGGVFSGSEGWDL